MKRIQIIAATVALLSTATATAGSESNLRFDTVSIAPSRSTSRAYSGKVEAKLERPIQVILQNVTLLFCIQQAYSVKEYQILGPGWIKRARYDITATLPPGSAPDRVWPALQTLLAERFNVSIRRETRELPVYALAAAKQGPKLHPAVDGNRGPLKFQPGSREGGALQSGRSASGTLRLDSVSVPEFCAELSRTTTRPVVDRTGLPGLFDFELQYGGAGPSISSALQQQLGLKLAPGKGPVEMLIVDSAVHTPVVN